MGRNAELIISRRDLRKVYTESRTAFEAALKLGVSQSALRYWLRKYKIPMKSRGVPPMPLPPAWNDYNLLQVFGTGILNLQQLSIELAMPKSTVIRQIHTAIGKISIPGIPIPANIHEARIFAAISVNPAALEWLNTDRERIPAHIAQCSNLEEKDIAAYLSKAKTQNFQGTV